jgi:diketogulonate reductase-like aldo/keto reductase
MSIKQTTVSFLHLLVEKMLKDYEIDDDGVICILSDNPRKNHYPFSMFDSKAQLRQSWMYMTILKQSRAVKRIDVSNFYASHLTKLFDVCQEFNLEKPFANEIQINPYVYCQEKETLNLCFQYNLQLIAYSPLGFNVAPIVLQDTKMQSIAEDVGISTAQLSLAWLLSKSICVIPKSNSILRQKENFASKDAIYNVLHFSTRSQKVKILQPSYSILLKNPKKTPTGCACWTGIRTSTAF